MISMWPQTQSVAHGADVCCIAGQCPPSPVPGSLISSICCLFCPSLWGFSDHNPVRLTSETVCCKIQTPPCTAQSSSWESRSLYLTRCFLATDNVLHDIFQVANASRYKQPGRGWKHWCVGKLESWKKETMSRETIIQEEDEQQLLSWSFILLTRALKESTLL